MTPAEVLPVAFDAAGRVVNWIVGIIADRRKSDEQIKAEAQAMVSHLVAKALSFRARVEADDEAALAEFKADMQPTHPEARDTMATPVIVPAVERRRLVVAEVGVCPACDHQPHMAGHCAGIRADGTRCDCELG